MKTGCGDVGDAALGGHRPTIRGSAWPAPRIRFLRRSSLRPRVLRRLTGMKPLYWFLAALVLFAAGAGLISVQHLGPAPDVTCLEEGQPSSGFSVEVNGEECRLNSEDFEAVWDYENNSARPVRLAGLGLVVVSIGLVVTGTVSAVRRWSRRRRAERLAAVG